MPTNDNLDALLPPDMALKAQAVGIKKAALPFWNTMVLAILAGAYVALGAIFAASVSAGTMTVKDASGVAAYTVSLPYGIVRLLMGLVFTLGLILVVVGGAELFTGNNLMIMAFLNGKVSLGQMLRNWGIVYVGNFIGSILTALVIFLSRQYTLGNGSFGLTDLNIAETKCSFSFIQAVALGILCNALVCLAVWLCYSARTTTDKILAIILPIAGFVTAGFEHSVANMYFIPVALLIKTWGGADFFTAIGKTAENFPHLTWQNFFAANLLPVTIGNIIGGAVMVGAVYWYVYLRGKNNAK